MLKMAKVEFKNANKKESLVYGVSAQRRESFSTSTFRQGPSSLELLSSGKRYSCLDSGGERSRGRAVRRTNKENFSKKKKAFTPSGLLT